MLFRGFLLLFWHKDGVIGRRLGRWEAMENVGR
jgi:hypothetical protein